MVKRGTCRFDPGRFVERAECFENRLGLVEQLLRCGEVSGGLAQRRPRYHRARDVILGADAFQDAHCGVDQVLRFRECFEGEALAGQPTGQALEL